MKSFFKKFAENCLITCMIFLFIFVTVVGYTDCFGANSESNVIEGALTEGTNTGSSSSSGSGGGGLALMRRFEFSDKYESFNVQHYNIEESEKQNMHDMETAMRRDEQTGDAWIVFETKHISSLTATSLHLPEDVAPMTVMFSKDGEEWTDSKIVPEISPTDGRWTKVTYSSVYVGNVRFVKFIWGVEENLQNWWNPYFIGMTVKSANPTATELKIIDGGNISLPMYDSKEIQLTAVLYDQLGLEMDTCKEWEMVKTDDEAITVSEGGRITVSHDMTVGNRFTVAVTACGIRQEKEFTLCKALPGDIDEDNIITDKDIEGILTNYGKIADINNRLCDVDKNGVIDIIDLCYAARYLNVNFDDTIFEDDGSSGETAEDTENTENTENTEDTENTGGSNGNYDDTGNTDNT